MGYWRDVGTMDSYFDAHMDLVSIHPIFNLYNYDWPIYTSYGPYPPAKFVHGHHGRFGEALNSAVSPGVVISGRADQRLGRLPRRARAQLHRGRQQRHPRRRADRAELPHPAGDHRQERHHPRGDVDRVRQASTTRRAASRSPSPASPSSARARWSPRDRGGPPDPHRGAAPAPARHVRRHPARLRRRRGDRRRRRLHLGPLLPALRRRPTARTSSAGRCSRAWAEAT